MSFRAKPRNLKSLSATQGRQYYVYILTNATRTLYVGVTNDLERRLHEHRDKLVPGFASKYNITWLAYYEQTSDVASAIAREKQIKAWRRSKKVALIESANPKWKDLSLEWQSDAARKPSKVTKARTRFRGGQ